MQPLQIIRLELVGFGQFRGRSITFGEGLNLIEGENEAGKSTVQAFLTGMFYGFFQPEAKRRSYTFHQEKYKPWDGGSYRGVLVCRRGERSYRIERSFDRDSESVRVYDAQTGEDCTQEFPYHPVTRQVQVGETLLGMTKTAFLTTASIAQLSCGSVSREESFSAQLNDRLLSMTGTGDTGLSLQAVLCQLEQKSEAIGTPKKSRTPYGQACQRQKELESEWTLACQKEAEELQLRRQRTELEQQLRQLQKEKTALEATIREGCRRQLEEKYLKAQNIKQRIERLEREQERLQVYSKVDLAAVDQAQKRLGARMQIARTAEKYRRANEQLTQRCRELENLYATLEVHSADEQLLQQYDLMCERSRQLAQQKEQIVQQKQQLAALTEQCRSIGWVDAEKLEADVQTMRRLSKPQTSSFQNAAWLALGVGAVLLVAAVATAVLVPSMRTAGALTAVPALALLMLGGFLLFRPAQHPSRRAKVLLEQLMDDYPQLNTQSDPLAAMEEMLRKAQLDNDRLEQYSRQQRTLEQELRDRIQTAQQLYQQLGQYLVALTGNPQADLCSKSLRESVGQAKRILAELQRLRLQQTQMQQEEQNCAQQIEQINASIAQALVTSDPQKESIAADELEYRRQGKRRYDEACIELNLQKQLFDETLGGYSYHELEQTVRSHAPSDGQEVPELSAAREQLHELEQQIEMISKQAANLDGLFQGREEAQRPSGQVLAELESVKELCEGYRFELEALGLAKEKLLHLSGQLHRDFAPQLNERVSAAIEQITEGRYTRVVIDQVLGVRVEDRQSGQLVEAANLSSGTSDLLYLVMRIELMRLLCSDCPIPLILDDSFTQIDDRRAAQLLRYLLQTTDGQILLFSCHRREGKMLEQAGIHFDKIVL